MVLRGEVGKRTVNARVDDGHAHSGAGDTELPEREHAERLVISRLKLRGGDARAAAMWNGRLSVATVVFSDTACTSGLAGKRPCLRGGQLEREPVDDRQVADHAPVDALRRRLVGLGRGDRRIELDDRLHERARVVDGKGGDPGIEQRRGAGGGRRAAGGRGDEGAQLSARRAERDGGGDRHDGGAGERGHPPHPLNDVDRTCHLRATSVSQNH